mmetsp:Transcript_111807/g.216651  ORF Transcript_111807/g.216651 Transcript_111807/m.216651 type:complete len:127 (+) Transcript_111807:83-463(+)
MLGPLGQTHGRVLLSTSLICCLWGRAVAEAGCEDGFAVASCLWFWCVLFFVATLLMLIIGCSLRAATNIMQKKEEKLEAEQREAKEQESHSLRAATEHNEEKLEAEQNEANEEEKKEEGDTGVQHI